MSIRVRPYGRSMRHPSIVKGDSKARDALHDVIQGMFAIANMVRALLVEGEDRSDLAEGVYQLLDQQCAILNGVYEELGTEENERDTLNEAKGIVRQNSAPSEALIEPAHKLRIQFIDSNTKAGVDPTLIGAALNLSNADVERVIARLRGGAPFAPKPAARAARA